MILAALGASSSYGAQGDVSFAHAKKFGAIDARRLAQADAEPGEWMTPAGGASGGYYSRLKQINEFNAAKLGFAWEYDLHTVRGLEATPVVVDGVLYTSGNWGKVYALDAASGRELWVYDPGVDGQWGRHACCDNVNRGVAVWKGRVYVGALDGYLHAIDAATGRRIWKVDTLPTRVAGSFPYTSTGHPVIAGNLVVIGNAGADLKGARGSISAYDLGTGKFRWRFYTVPRDPRLGPQDQPHLEAAADTWPRDYDWSNGGGGTVWDGLSYDPQLHLIYIGTANPAPYVIGKDALSGDQLYTNSIVAIREQTGSLAWHFQEVPGDGWDYDAVAKMVLTDLKVDGRSRMVLIQAAKDGFVYVLDRVTGELLSAHPYARINWTIGLDPRNHRPIRNPDANYEIGPKLIAPGMSGAHNWQPTSYSPDTGLLYIPVIEGPMVYIETAHRPAALIEYNFTVAGVWSEEYVPSAMSALFGALPPLEGLAQKSGGIVPRSSGVLRAIDPLTGRRAWEQAGRDMWDGGITSTAGNLVLRGDSAGEFNVYQATSGELLAKLDVGTGMMAAPTTYMVDGVQYIAVMAGYGGGNAASPFPEGSAAQRYVNAGRIVAFKLNGGETPKPPLFSHDPFPQPPPRDGSPEQIEKGGILYNRYCSRCHVFGHGMLPDLRRLSPAKHSLFYDIVLEGALRGLGMGRWDDVLSRADAEAIHAYIVDEAWQAFEVSRPATSP